MAERYILKTNRGGTSKMNVGSGKNFILDEGEIFLEYPDTGVGSGKSKFKVGDGTSVYTDLPYAIGDTSTDPITFTQGSQQTAAAALAAVTSGGQLDGIVGNMKQAVHLCDEGINTINNETIPNLQQNFQAGVNSIYDAVVAKGVTPASKSLSDVVAGINAIETKTIHTETYNATNRASNLDMGSEHEYRYVNTNGVPNSNSGTYSATSRASNLDMGATNSYRYVNTNGVPNSCTATYPNITSNGSKDLGAAHNYRYLNVQVPNSNSGTWGTTITSNGTKDLGSSFSYRYVKVQVPNTCTSTYNFPANDTGGTKDLGATNDTRYVNASNVYNKGKADGVTVHTETYTFPANDTGATKDLGTTHTYRYVNASNVYTKGKVDGHTEVDYIMLGGAAWDFYKSDSDTGYRELTYTVPKNGTVLVLSGAYTVHGDDDKSIFTINGQPFSTSSIPCNADLNTGTHYQVYCLGRDRAGEGVYPFRIATVNAGDTIYMKIVGKGWTEVSLVAVIIFNR